ncbi:MAG: zf-HC2 domain-containing protein, partial [Acidimicrobiales bacterium]
MSDNPRHEDIQELLGAYSLGAADEGERAMVEAHLETCESCRSELEDHRRVAEALRRHASRVSPLASAEANGSQELKKSEDVAPARPGRRWGVPAVMAVALLIAGGLFTQL